MQSVYPAPSSEFGFRPTKAQFYLLSLTWGLFETAVGACLAAGLIATGHKPKKWGLCCAFELGEGWGGFSVGPFFVTQKNAPARLKNHEHGHALQNCIYGPLMPFVINGPSTCRYWYRRAVKNRKALPPYDSVWFENDATKRGNEYVKNLEKL